ncbi:hypothetical protein MPL1_07428 [Methylophaga lonarensis MPL]|uniref:Surface antigen domain-containing protein n=1 Tax=Methylophaga lonarensis MPL TaxID=1286106 RepID=M7P0F6_9GAMM|nr:hypothetical protein MPL1_07428 [Methylophaga lonarensis MPL]
MLLACGILAVPADASLELLAGVEAGIDTDTAMTSSDLDRTQQVLSTREPGQSHAWHNSETGIQYEIEIRYPYTYGLFPCLAYNLTIRQQNNTETKSLDACKSRNGHWVSVMPSSQIF